GLALGLLFWGLSVRGTGEAPADLPGFSLGNPAGSLTRGGKPALAVPSAAPAGRALPTFSLTANREATAQLLRGLRMPSALFLTIAGQALLIAQPLNYGFGLLLMVLGVGLFAANLAVDHLLGAPRQEAEWVEVRLSFRWWLLAIALLTGAFG